MSDQNPGFEQMMRFWTDGQKAMLDTQKQMMDNFQETFAPKPKDPISQSMDAWAQFVRAWAPGWDPSAMMAQSLTHGFEQQRDAFMSLFDPSNWMAQAPEQLRAILDNIAKAPKFADMAFPQADMAAHFQEAMDFQSASTAFATVIQAAWQRAYERFIAKYSLEDLQSANPTEALNDWLKFANDELLETQSSEAFMTAQRDLIASTAAVQKRQAGFAEDWAKAYQMPTRSEVDDLAKTIAELKREIRALKRAAKNS